MKVRRDYREVLLLWTDFYGERVPTLRDSDGRLLYPFNEYLDELSQDLRERAVGHTQRASEMDSTTYAIKALCDYLAQKGKTVLDLDQTLLRDFRDDALKRVKASDNHRGDENAARRTVNAKLRRIYKCLYKCQRAHRLPKDTIGSTRCKIASSWPQFDESPSELLNQDRRKHPLCFAGIGEGSREDNSLYFATKKDIAAIEELFWGQANSMAAMRNVMMLRIFEHMGWRVASLNSLTAHQFSDAALASQAHLGQFIVVPPHQKGGHTYTFSMPFELACQINEFINGPRQACLKEIGATESTTEGRLFFSVKTGKPLTDGSVTEIFADAFKAVKAPKGSGAHSLRRFVGQETADEEVAFRRANKLSLDREDVERAIQEKLGHSSVLSQRVYRRALSKLRRSDQVARLQNEVLEQQGKVMRLNSDLQQAEQTIRELEAALSASTSRPKKATPAKRPPSAQRRPRAAARP